MPSKQKINVLYTGGLDSSYTMILLSRCDVEIQPYYLRDNRHSEEKELSSIRNIIDHIIGNENTRCTILPLITISTADVEKDQEITEAYNRLRESTNIGSQYDWLARFAKNIEGLCMSLEKSSKSKALACITKYGDIKLQREGKLDFYMIDSHKSSSDLIKVFGRFRFPYIVWTKTKSEAAEDFKKLGFENALFETWFCFNPIDGKPCGTCNPCRSAIEDGMKWRFSEDALWRYRIQKIKIGLSKIKRKIIA